MLLLCGGTHQKFKFDEMLLLLMLKNFLSFWIIKNLHTSIFVVQNQLQKNN